jgi:tRNA threonylcarbamoyladenosine biosynthesis protein TsaE
LRELALALACEVRPGDRVLLEGPMGAGKSTFARALLEGLGVTQPPEGSPTFAIAHEYQSRAGAVAHIDFYRLRSEVEIEDVGIPAYFWERRMIVIAEWTSMWPEFEQQVRVGSGDFHVWSVRLDFTRGDDERREIVIEHS